MAHLKLQVCHNEWGFECMSIYIHITSKSSMIIWVDHCLTFNLIE